MKITVNWDKLQITQIELDRILDLNLWSNWSIDLNRLLRFGKRKYLKSILITELSILFLGLLLFFPINLIIFRKLSLLSNNVNGFLIIVAIALLLDLLLLLLLNYYLWHTAKRFKSLALILEKINDYNYLINNLQLITQFNSLNSDRVSEPNYFKLASEIETALTITKDSLIKSIEIEKFLLDHHQIRRDSYQLLNSLEENLIEFISLPHNNFTNEYQQTLSEIIEIGLSVHQEVRKNQTLR